MPASERVEGNVKRDNPATSADSVGLRAPLRFGTFVVDPLRGELRRNGTLVRLQGQPMQLLLVLLERPGQIVSREEMQQKLWSSDTFVEFDAGLNTAIKKVRQALGDTAENPRFVETVPKVGYRFIAPVHSIVVEMPPQPAPATDLPTPKRTAPPNRWLRIGAAVAVTFLLMALGLSGRANRPAAQAATTRFEIVLPPDQSLGNGYSRGIALSPDGRTLVYAAFQAGRWRLFRRELNEWESHPIPGTEDSWTPSFQPEGTRIAYVRGAEYRSSRLDGSDVRKELALGEKLLAGSAGGTWGANGGLYFTDAPPKSAESGLSSAVWVKHGEKRTALTAKLFGQGPEWHFVQQELPGASHLLFSLVRTPEDRDIAAYSLTEGTTKIVVRGGTGGRYLPTGHLLYSVPSKGGRLYAAPFDLSRLEVTGAPVELPAVGHDGWRSPTLAVSDTGTIVYRPAPAAEANTMTWVDLSGNQAPLPMPPGSYRVLDIAPDGKRLLIAKQDAGDGMWYVWRYESGPGSWTRIGAGTRSVPQALWAPDGERLVTSAELHGTALPNLYLSGLDGAAPRRVHESWFGQFPASWSKSNNLLAYVEGTRPDRGSDIWIKDMGSAEPARELVGGPQFEAGPAFSPDGRWLAYNVDTRLYVRALTGTQAWLLADTGSGPLWAPDGKTIYFRQRGGVSAVAFQPGPVPAIGQPEVVFSGDYLMPDCWARNYSLSPDGKRFLMVKAEQNPLRHRTLRVVLNWFEELQHGGDGPPGRSQLSLGRLSN